MGYDFWRAIDDQGHHFVMRVGSNVTLLRKLGYARESHGILYCWPSKFTRKQPPLVLRLVSMRFGRTPVYLVTNILDENELPDAAAMQLYQLRWGIELDLRSIKQSMHMDVLRCKTPEMVIKEIYCHLLAWNLLRGVMTASAKKNGVMPRQLSVKGTMQAVESFTPAMMATAQVGDILYDVMLLTESTHRVGNRPGRQTPRLKKRRPVWRELMMKPRNEYHRRLAKDALANTR